MAFFFVCFVVCCRFFFCVCSIFRLIFLPVSSFFFYWLEPGPVNDDLVEGSAQIVTGRVVCFCCKSFAMCSMAYDGDLSPLAAAHAGRWHQPKMHIPAAWYAC